MAFSAMAFFVMYSSALALVSPLFIVTPVQAIKAMEIELTYLRQEVDFLKKLYSLIPPGDREEE